MGTWSSDAFGNDTACDWAYILEKVDDLALIERTVAAVLAAGNAYLEVPEAEEGLAAVDVIARLRGNWGIRNAYTATVDVWVSAHPLPPSPALVQQAQAVIARVQSPPSELLELWTESNALAEWQAELSLLAARLDP